MTGLYQNTMYAKEMYDRAFAAAGRGTPVGPRHAPRPKARGLFAVLRDAAHALGRKPALEGHRAPLAH